MDFKDFWQPHKVKWLAIVLAGVVVVLAVFQLGMYVGFKKANYSYLWADNYHRSFGMPMGGFWRDVEGEDFTGGHGVAGKIIKIDGGNLYVTGSDNIEKVISVDDSTRIMQARTVMKLSDLKIDDQIVVIGSPSDGGVIQAKMIRVFSEGEPIQPMGGATGGMMSPPPGMKVPQDKFLQ